MKTTSLKSRGYASRSIGFNVTDKRRLFDVLNNPSRPYLQSGGTQSRIKPRQIASGAYKGQQFAGDSNFQYNQSDGNLLIRDGVTNRFLAGKQEDGF